ncbi:hypothetical protein [Acuticoccus mangrovi]|uniref:Uncharacterized protein n=1 Tax=Acuticoccus mangrovi TaxID=2796142 RepID=A0A934IIY4_9HYPH|nr:hypothetical protein [Acuticoccus mangrovi]MBJ3777318.1 hypothetical protein [Acuticoccus mangrovi]
MTGPWSGKGFVQKDEGSRPMNVSCKIKGEQTADTIGFAGACRAMLILKREIGAQLKRVGDRFVGTYKGADVGIAELDGSYVDGETVELTMTFPRSVNGDDVAKMTITTPGDGTFTIETSDKMESGVEVTTSSILFSRD